MRYTILFVIALILVSGFVAYFGDLLGRRMGKKRLTLFGLRPRHTAIIVTTITGMLISALALFALVAVNSQFRRILTRGEQIIAQNERLSTANMALEKVNRGLETRSAELLGQVETQKREVSAARAELAKAQSARDKAVAAVARLRKEIAARQKQLAELRAGAEAAERDLARRTAELESARGDLRTTREQLAAAQAQFADARNRLADAQARLKEAVERFSQMRDELAKMDETLKEKEALLAKQQAKLIQLEKLKTEFEIDASSLRYRDFVYRQGDELARGTISARQSEFGLRGELYSLLERASADAVARGAAVGPNGRAVSVIFRQLLGNQYLIYEDDEAKCVNLAASTIAGSPQDVLVKVACAMNALPGEQVPVEFQLYLNYVIYTKGDRIAGTRIDGRLSEGRILIALIDFLRTEVSGAALRAGIVPVTRPEPRMPTGYDAREVEEQMAIVERIKAMGGPARVEVYATADIRAGDSLTPNNIRFSVAKID